MSYIYLLSNNAMPGLIKIGRTTRNPGARATELYTTGVPCGFVVEKSWRVSDSNASRIERDLHRRLSAYRLNKKREFFELQPDQAAGLVNRYFNELSGGPFDSARDRRLFSCIIVCCVAALTVLTVFL